MTDNEMRELTDTLKAELRPVCEVTERVLTIVEGLVQRVEVLELERLHERASKMEDEAGRTDAQTSVQP